MRPISVLVILLAVAPAWGQRKQSSPLDHLPPNLEVLTHFGERADISPDNRQVVFMAKSFGDAFAIDLETRALRCLTCNVPGAAFLRVMHLRTGDYILIGAERFEDIKVSRARDNELWFLSRKPGSKPLKLGQKMSEGAAISKQSMTIAFSIGHAQDSSIPPNATRLFTAEVDLSGPVPTLKNKQVVFESPDLSCYLEAQDFFDNDTKMTFSCYEPEGKSSAWTIDLKSRQTVNQSQAIGYYNEAEGIFPDGLHTCVESDHQSRAFGDPASFRNIDIWKLRLDGTGKDFTRLTDFNDYDGWKASNPVVSTDGRFMAFQVGRTQDEAGVGYGILISRLNSK
jgi:hypothetical protein